MRSFTGDLNATGNEDGGNITGTLNSQIRMMVHQIQTLQSVPMEQTELQR